MNEAWGQFLADVEKIAQSSEEECYEKLAEIAELAPERSIHAIVRSKEEIKAAYRAAIYGEISLLFGNILTEEDAEKAKQSANLAFRELLEEKHEFNGFIPKGILIDTPLSLLSNLPTEGIDFFCYDTEKLSVLLSEEKKAAQEHRKALDTVIQKNMNRSLPARIIRAKIKIEQGVWMVREE